MHSLCKSYRFDNLEMKIKQNAVIVHLFLFSKKKKKQNRQNISFYNRSMNFIELAIKFILSLCNSFQKYFYRFNLLLFVQSNNNII